LTPAGAALLDAARRALALAADGVEAARRAALGESGTLTLGFAASVMLTPVAGLIGAYRERHPGVHVRLREMVTAAQLDALRAGEIDAGFLREPPASPDLATQPVWRERFAIAIPTRHPLAARRSLPLRALAGEPFVLVPRAAGAEFYDQIVALCHAAGFAPRIAQEAIEWQTVIGLVAAGLGVSVVPDGVRAIRAAGVTYRPLSRAMPGTTVVLGWRAGDESPTLAGLHALVRGGYTPARGWRARPARKADD
ncbi:MAG TPA: LysR family substrate-binding domain-containing protein, partial [Gemmatimonadaceae bacterium]|nr:LysR family substrate-binding domain-containing protein [Gemmatimonadaceae bacterium]